MCSSIYSNKICAVKEDVDLKCLRLAEEINILEQDLEEARTAFTRVVVESTASLNSIRLKFGACVEDVLKNQRETKQIEFKPVSDKSDVANRQIEFLQKELEKGIVNSGCSIKISLMKLSSLFAQQNLLFLPFCELKEYYNQLRSQKKCDILKLKSQVVVTSKLSYAEALQNMKEISDEIDKTKKRISSLTDEQRNVDSTILDPLNIFTNEYKHLP